MVHIVGGISGHWYQCICIRVRYASSAVVQFTVDLIAMIAYLESTHHHHWVSCNHSLAPSKARSGVEWATVRPGTLLFLQMTSLLLLLACPLIHIPPANCNPPPGIASRRLLNHHNPSYSHTSRHLAIACVLSGWCTCSFAPYHRRHMRQHQTLTPTDTAPVSVVGLPFSTPHRSITAART